jgi:hypothetical protein
MTNQNAKGRKSVKISQRGMCSCIRPEVLRLGWLSDCSDWLGAGWIKFYFEKDRIFLIASIWTL